MNLVSVRRYILYINLKNSHDGIAATVFDCGRNVEGVPYLHLLNKVQWNFELQLLDTKRLED